MLVPAILAFYGHKDIAATLLDIWKRLSHLLQVRNRSGGHLDKNDRETIILNSSLTEHLPGSHQGLCTSHLPRGTSVSGKSRPASALHPPTARDRSPPSQLQAPRLPDVEAAGPPHQLASRLEAQLHLQNRWLPGSPPLAAMLFPKPFPGSTLSVIWRN